MKKYFTLLALLSLLFINDSEAQKLTFIDSFEVYHHYKHWANSDTLPNIFESDSGKLVGFGVNRSAGYFYQFTLINGQFEKTDSAAFKGEDDLTFQMGELYKGQRCITHHKIYPKLSPTTSKMDLTGPSKKYKTLGSWEKGKGLQNFTRNQRDSNLIVYQIDQGTIYKGLYHFHGEVIGQGHTGQRGLYSYDGDSIRRIVLDLNNEFDNPDEISHFQIKDDTIFFIGRKRASINENVHKCDYATGKLFSSNTLFNDDKIKFSGAGGYHYIIKEIEGGGYFRPVRLKNSTAIKDYIQISGLGIIDGPSGFTHLVDAVWQNNMIYFVHQNVWLDKGTGVYESYISKFSNGKWSTEKYDAGPWVHNARFIKGENNLYVKHTQRNKYNRNRVVHHVYSIDASTSSIEILKNPTFSLYPNPTTGICNIQSASDESINKVEVYNLMGTKLKEYHVNNQQYQLDISDLATGMYVVRINEERTLRIIKSND